MNPQKLMLAGVSLVVAIGLAGCETKESHEQEIDSSSNSVRGPQDFNEEAQKLDNREPKRVPVDPQRDPNDPATTQTEPNSPESSGTPNSPGNN